MDIVEKIKRRRFISAYRKVNHQNETFPGNMFDIRDVTIGKKTYGTIRIFNDVKNAHLYIGSFCSIGDNVVFLLGIDHPTNFISTFPFRVKIEKKDEMEAISKGNIVVDDDVWIGYGATILSGVHIDDLYKEMTDISQISWMPKK